MEECIRLVGYDVDTLILNVRHSDSRCQPVKQELDYLQGLQAAVEARSIS